MLLPRNTAITIVYDLIPLIYDSRYHWPGLQMPRVACSSLQVNRLFLKHV